MPHPETTRRVVSTPMPRGGRPTVAGFELLDELGRGGMGVVYKARQTGLNRTVALKMILSGGHARESDRLRFLSEAEAVAAVLHPNVVQVYEFGEANGTPYFAMEYLGGGSLSRRLADHGRMGAAAAAKLVEQVARGVQAAHDVGLVHRDIKPANILMAGGDEQGGSRLLAPIPKVTDFGLAKRATSLDLTLTGVVMGTPAYMAPEQAAGKAKRVGPGADIYALGVILYECLAGRTPFVEDDSAALIARVAFDDPPPLRRFAPGVPRDLELICMKCLAKTPAERYPSAASLADDLGRFLVGEPVSVRPAGRLEKAAKWVRRYPTSAAAYGLTLLTAASLGLTTSAVKLRREAEASRRFAEGAATAAVSARDRADAARGDADAARSRAEAAEQQLAVEASYRAIDLASRELDAHDTGRVRDVLADVRADQRGWEWRYLDRMTRREAAILAGDGGEVTGLAFAGGALLTAGQGGVLAWDLGSRTARPVAAFRAAKVAATPDGRRILAGSLLKAKVFDAETGAELAEVSALPGGWAAISPLGDQVVACRNGAVAVTNLRPKFTFADWYPPGTSRCGAFTPSGQFLAIGGAASGVGTVRFFNLLNQREEFSLGPHGQAVARLAFSADGRRLATVADDGGVRVWDVPGRRPLPAAVGLGAEVTAVALNADGTRVGTGSLDRAVRVWDVATGVELFTFAGHPTAPTDVTFDPATGNVVSAGKDGAVRVWDTAGQPDRVRLAGLHPLDRHLYPTLLPDGRVHTSDGKLGNVNDSRTGAVAAPLLPPLPGVAWAGAGPRALTKDGAMWAWETTGGRSLGAVPIAAEPDDRGVVAASADSSRVAVLGRGVRILDAKTGGVVCRLAPPPSGYLTGFAFSPDGKWLAAGAGDRRAAVWDAATGRLQLELRGHSGDVTAAAFSPDGTRVATAAQDGKVKLWDAATGRELLTLRCRGLSRRLEGVAFGPDGSKLIALDEKGVLSVFDAGPP